MRLSPRALVRALFGVATIAAVVVVALPGAVSFGAARAATGVGATGNDSRPFPRTFHIWGGSPSKYTMYDLVIGYPSWDLASLRSANPDAIYLVNPQLDPFNPDWRQRKGVAVTYGAMNTFSGATDAVTDGLAARLGTIPAWDTYWDTLHRPDGSVALINSTWRHPGWNLTRPETAEKVAKIEAYAAKLSRLYRAGWDGIWSDNWIYRIGASWFYGTDLDTDRDGVRDDIGVVSRRWWDGLTLVGHRLRSYLPGKTVGGNGAHNIAGLVGGSDASGPYKATNVTMNEVLQLYTTRPDTVVQEVQSYLGFPDPYGMPRRFLLMHKLPGGQTDYRSMRWGFSLATIAGAYYEPYATSHEDVFIYDEFTGGSTVGKRGWLGAPVSPPTKLGNGVWRRDFENGIVLNNSTSAPQTVVLGRPYRRLSGTQAPEVNNGATVTSVTIPAGDGLFLLDSASGAVAAPTSTAPPTVSGTPAVGSTLNSTTGSWTGSPTSYRFQWQRCEGTVSTCVDIAGATAASYAIVRADVGSTLRVAVTASNSAGATTAVSAATAPVATDASSPTSGIAQNLVDGQVVSGAIRWEATPTAGVQRVEFLVDGGAVATRTQPPYEIAYDTRPLADGTHSFGVRAYGSGSGPVAQVSALVRVANRSDSTSSRFVVSQNVTNDQTLSERVTWTATVSGATVSKVEFFIDGTLAWTERYAPYVFGGDGKVLDTTTLRNGTHVLGVVAYATDGRMASATASVVVSNAAPLIASSIKDGSTITGQVSWTVTADALQVSRVEFFIDGTLMWTERYAPYVYGGDGRTLDANTLARGQHVLAVRVVATSGAVHSLSLRVTVP